MKKRLLALLLAALMVLSTMPVNALATDEAETGDPAAVTETTGSPTEDDEPTAPMGEDEPADPTEEDEPAAPADEDEPADPADDKPADPADEDEPANPTDDDEPANPADDDKPANPTDDDEPVDPADDDELADPADDEPAVLADDDEPADTLTDEEEIPLEETAIEGESVELGENGILAQGTVGSGVWSLDDEGLFTLGKGEGNGDLANDVTYDLWIRPPWETYKDQILSLVVEDGVTSLPGYGFLAHENLRTVVLPEGLVRVEQFLFERCSSLETITIPRTVTGFGTFGVHGTNIQTVYYGGSDADWDALMQSSKQDVGTVFRDAEITCRAGTVSAISVSGYKTEYWLDEPLTLEGTAVTATLSTGQSQTMPASLLTTGPFDSSTPGEKTVTVSYRSFSDSFTVTVRNAYGVFVSGPCGAQGDNLIWTLTTDGVLTVTGTGQMKDYSSNNDRPAWSGYCKRIRTVILEEGVTSVGKNAFNPGSLNDYPYEQLTSFQMPSTLESIGDYSFTHTPLTGHLILPENLTYVGAGAFGGCAGLETAEIRCQLSGSSVFAESGLREVLITGSGWSTVHGLFMGCTSLAKVTITGAGTGIPNQFFRRCSALQTLVLPAGIESIGEQAFYGCSGLSEFQIPDSVSSIGTDAFNGCTGLTSITVPTGLTVGGTAFADCTGLLTADVGSVGNSMFSGCSGLREAVLREGVTSLPNNIFSGCTSLTTLSIPASVTSYGIGVFTGVSPLPAFTGEGAQAASVYFDFHTDANGVVYSGDWKELISVPSSFSGMLFIRSGTESIAEKAAQNCISLTAIQFPTSLVHIGSSAFWGCSELREVTVPDSVTTIDHSAFYNCTKLSRIILPTDLDRIPDSIFFGCSSLTGITLPETITEIGSGAFWNCIGLKAIDIPEGVTTIGVGAFMNCTALQKIELPSAVRSIGGNAFRGCECLTSFVIPTGVEEIQSGMLDGCPNIETIVIPYTVRWIGLNAFDILSLKTIYFTGGYAELYAIEWEAEGNKNVLNRVEVICYYGNAGDPADAPVILVEPEDRAFHQGDDAANALSLTIQPIEPEERVYFDWFISETESAANGRRVESEMDESGLTSFLTPSTEEKGNLYYYCIVTKIAADQTITQATSRRACVAVLYEAFEGQGSPANPYKLSSLEDLAALREMVEQGEQFKGIWFALTGDITLPSDWRPIGCKFANPLPGRATGLTPFVGNLDGGGHTVTVGNGGKTLFGYVRQTTIKNLNIFGESIDGPGLVAYTAVDYGDDGVYSTGVPAQVTIINCTILSGTSMSGAGFVYGGGSSGNLATISGCVVQENVNVKDGSFVSSLIGTITDCVSYANVTGVNNVGGLVGNSGNSVAKCWITNSQFHGTVTGNNNVGGIIGAGYIEGSAPNPCLVRVQGCTISGTVTGVNNVGGILGSEGGLQQSYNAGSAGHIRNNIFSGTINGTGENVGAIIGLYSHLDRYTVIENNFYAPGCGASIGIGRVYHVDTNGVPYGWHDGVFYFDSSRKDYTAEQLEEIYTALWTGWEDSNRWKPSVIIPNENRSDDPLNAGHLTGEGIPDTWVVELTISGDYRTEYTVGDQTLDLSGLTVTATYTNIQSELTEVEVDLSQVEITGFETDRPGEKTITFSYEGVSASIVILVKNPAGNIIVKFSVLGDTHHTLAEGESGHGFWVGGLLEWMSKKVYTIDSNATAYDLAVKAFTANPNMTMYSRFTPQYDSEYIYAVQMGSVILQEKDNGVNSGWMVAINGEHVQVGVSKMYLSDGDEVVLHWCDDYIIDEAEGRKQENDKYAAFAVEFLIDAIANAATEEERQAATFAALEAWNALTDDQKALVLNADILFAPPVPRMVLIPNVGSNIQKIGFNKFGEITEDPAQIVSYAVYLDAGTAQTLTVSSQAYKEDGSITALTGKQAAYTTTDKTVAAVKADSDGTAKITISAIASGAATITAKAKSLGLEGSISVYVREYTPRLESNAITVNPAYEYGTKVRVAKAYDNAVTGVAIDDANFTAAMDGDQLIIKANSGTAEKTYKTTLTFTTDKGEFPAALKITVKSAAPAVLADQAVKYNDFYTDSEAVFLLAADEEIESVTFAADSYEAQPFVPWGDGSMGELHLVRKAGVTKVSPKGELTVKVAGYSKEFTKTVTVAAETVKPKLSLDKTKLTVNTAYGSKSAQTAFIGDMPMSEPTWAVKPEGAADVAYDGGDFTITSLTGKKATVTISVKEDNWAAAMSFKVTLAVNGKLPVMKAETGTLVINTAYPDQPAVTAVTLNTDDLEPGMEKIELKAKQAEGDKLLVEYADGQITASVRNSADLPAAGTCSFTFTPKLADGTALKDVTVKVKAVSSSKITAAVTAAGKLDAIARQDSAIIYTLTGLDSATGEIVDAELKGADAELFDAELLDEPAKGLAQVKLTLKDGAKVQTKVKYSVVLAFTLEGEIPAETKPLTVKVTQSKLKIALEPRSATLFQGEDTATAPAVFTLTLTSPVGAAIERVELSEKTPLAFWQSLGKNAKIETTFEGGGAIVEITVKDPSKVVNGKTYKVLLDVYPVGCAADANPTTVTATVVVKK